jgi:hypothetical protein
MLRSDDELLAQTAANVAASVSATDADADADADVDDDVDANADDDVASADVNANADANDKACSFCGATTATKKCSECKVARYCCRECQTKDWTAHKAFCKQLKANRKSKKKK